MVVLPIKRGRARLVSGRRGDGSDGLGKAVMSHCAQQLGDIRRVGFDGEDGYVVRVQRRGAEAHHAPRRADIDKDIAGLEMDIEKDAGRVLESVMPAFAFDQMLDRDVIEKLFRGRLRKSRIARNVAKDRKQKERAVRF